MQCQKNRIWWVIVTVKNQAAPPVGAFSLLRSSSELPGAWRSIRGRPSPARLVTLSGPKAQKI